MNCSAQLQTLITALAFRCIDVEGGTVDRLRDLIAPMPSPSRSPPPNKPALFANTAASSASEVRMLGLNTTFAPVLDLRTPRICVR